MITLGGQKLTCSQMRKMDLCLGEHCCGCIAYAPEKTKRFIGSRLRLLAETWLKKGLKNGKLVCNLIASII